MRACRRSAGVDFINEGELTKGGHWVEYLPTRLGGYEPSETGGGLRRVADVEQGLGRLREFYLAVLQNGTLFEMSGATQHVPEGAEETATPVDDWVATSPIHFKGQSLLEREIAMMKAASATPRIRRVPHHDGAAQHRARSRERLYTSDEEHIYAIAEAMRVEYEAIADAGFQVQVDDAWMGALWDRIGIPMGIDGYRKFCEMRCEALNHALRNIPEEQIRYHLCWGSWHGPHSADLPLPDIVDIMLKIKAQMYLIEAANVRHEHEAALWENTKLPDGKMLAPGVVTHSTPLIEHPQLVANRIERFAGLVGRENVIASTDCGLGFATAPIAGMGETRLPRRGSPACQRQLVVAGVRQNVLAASHGRLGGSLGDDRAVAPASLGGVQRMIGFTHEPVGIAGVGEQVGDAEADRDLAVDTWHGNGGDGEPDLLGHLLGTLEIGVGQEHEELLAAEATSEVAGAHGSVAIFLFWHARCMTAPSSISIALHRRSGPWP